MSIVSKTSRPVLDLRCASETDHTFVLENCNGLLGLSNIATSLISGKSTEANDDEEEKVDQSADKPNSGSEPAYHKISKDVIMSVLEAKNDQPLDFYQIPSDRAKLTKGKLFLDF